MSDPRGVNTVTTETLTTLNQTTGQQVTTVSTRAVNEQKLTISAEFAKRFGFATFRVGIIESSGGVGSDLHFFDDALQISVDLYQFTRATQDVFPRAKLWANWHFLDHFYLTAGTDALPQQGAQRRLPRRADAVQHRPRRLLRRRALLHRPGPQDALRRPGGRHLGGAVIAHAGCRDPARGPRPGITGSPAAASPSRRGRRGGSPTW